MKVLMKLAIAAALVLGGTAPAHAGRVGQWQTCVPEPAFDEVQLGWTRAQVREVFGGPGRRAGDRMTAYQPCLTRGTTGVVLMRYRNGRVHQAWWIEL